MCKVSVVFLVVTPGHNKLAHITLVLGEIKCAICLDFFILKQVKFSKKEGM